MTQLGEWLKHIVVIVLISTIADLLLPTKAMQRYVRAVLGLAIIAAMIQPIVPFFHHNWADELASAAQTQFSSSGSQSTSATWGQYRQSYGNTLSQEEEQDADHTLAASLKANLSHSLSQYVTKVTVSNATSSQNIHVDVIVDTTDTSIQRAIRDTIANEVNVAPANVTVRTDGGQ